MLTDRPLRSAAVLAGLALALTGCTEKVTSTDVVTASGLVHETVVQTLVLDNGAAKPNAAALQKQIHAIDPASHAVVKAAGPLGVVITDSATEKVAVVNANGGAVAAKYSVSMESTSESGTSVAPGKGEYLKVSRAGAQDSEGTDPVQLTQTAHSTTFAITWSASERKQAKAALAQMASGGLHLSETMRFVLPGKVIQHTGVDLNADGSFTVNLLALTNVKVVATR